MIYIMKRFFLLSIFSFIVNLSFGQIEYDIVQGDATICDWSNAKIIIESDADEISWSPSDSLSCDSCFVLNANPSMTTTYTGILKKKAEGNEVISVTITVKPNDAHFPQGDTLYVCKGTSKLLTLEMENTSGDVHWTSSEGLDSMIVGETMSDTLLTPQDNMIFYASAANTSDCVDSIVIQVDSLPGEREIKIIDPAMPPYCIGQQFIMQSPHFEQSHFPNIDFFWTPPVEPEDGTPDSLYNLVWTAHEAKVYTYTREVTNGACKVVDSIDVPVMKVMDVVIDPGTISGCIGSEIPILVKATDSESKEPVANAMYEWKQGPAVLSCGDCGNPRATIATSGFVKVKVTDAEYCPGEGGFDVKPENNGASLPLVFTPNSDGKNEYFTFKIKDDDVKVTPDQIVSFQIFNRWGTKVYDNETPDTGWDGKINGKDASQDVYLYQVELGDFFCNEKIIGDVTLLR